MAMQLQQTIKSFIRPGEQSGYVAECLEISVVTQGETLDEVVSNLKEAISLHLEYEDPADFGLVAHPSVLVTFELQPSYAQV
jgi:predicted RNase H-like HicB family nuclease